MKVREVLEIAREAAVKLRMLEEKAEVLHQAIGVQGHNSFEVHGKCGILDPMRHVIELMDWQDEMAKEADLHQAIADAVEIVDGIEHITDGITVEVITRYYLQGESMRELVDGYRYGDVSYPPLAERDDKIASLSRAQQFDWLKESMDIAIDQWERIGIAHLKEMGQQ